MTAKHTPGPWCDFGPFDGEDCSPEEPGKRWIGIHTGGPGDCGDEIAVLVKREPHEFTDQDWANAKLIAAAPQLLSMLLATVRAIDAGELLCRWSDEFVRENGLDSNEANQDSARALLRSLGCDVKPGGAA